MLTCYTDESDSGDRAGVSVVAGFVAPVDYWLKFSDDWETVRQDEPSIPFYRMNSLRSPEWLAQHNLTRDAARRKTDEFSKLITGSELWSVRAIMLQKDFFEIIRSRLSDRAAKTTDYVWLTSPYYFLLVDIFGLCIRRMKQHQLRDASKIDFFVDENGKISKHAQSLFFGMKQTGDECQRQLMGTCAPLDDKETPALQAADMFAGHVRQILQGRQMLTPTVARLRQVWALKSEWTRERLHVFAETLSGFPFSEKHWD